MSQSQSRPRPPQMLDVRLQIAVTESGTDLFAAKQGPEHPLPKTLTYQLS